MGVAAFKRVLLKSIRFDFWNHDSPQVHTCIPALKNQSSNLDLWRKKSIEKPLNFNPGIAVLTIREIQKVLKEMIYLCN